MFDEINIWYVWLDGIMIWDECLKVIDVFKFKKNVEVLLVFMRVGGVGLNLIVVFRCYFVDFYWNLLVEF